MKKFLIFFTILIFFHIRNSFPQQSNLFGRIEGIVLDAETKTPLIGANVIVVGTERGAASDVNGKFAISKMPVGNFTLRFDYIGYQQVFKPDVIVRSNRITNVSVELQMSALAGESVVVTGGYFSESKDQPTSIINFSSEEIRRAPGSGGDVSRIIMGLPSLAKVNDQSNSLIVRGGSPIENAFYVDNIEIPNINHFPTQGASGGPIGIINVDFIQDVNFYTGGFSSIYGDKLSSIMDLSFRQGNRSEFDGQLDLNFAGFGGIVEGALFQQKGSYLISARRSYLDFLVDAFDIGTSVAPRYGDLHSKIVYDLNPRHQISLLAIWADDHNNPDKNAAVENKMIYYGRQDIYERTTGLNWRALWSSRGYSNTSFSLTGAAFDEDFIETNTGMNIFRNNSRENSFKLRNINHFRLSGFHSVEFGLEAKYISAKYDNYFWEHTNALGNMVSEANIMRNINGTKAGIFVNYIARPLQNLTSNIGIRADYFSLNENLHISPRFALTYGLSNVTFVNFSAGLFYQNLPFLFLAQTNSGDNLEDAKALHYVFGIDHLLTENTKLTVEVYQKDYSDFPVDPASSSLFLLDEIFYSYAFFVNHDMLESNGKAFSRGIEIMVQKKLAEKLYGLASASYFRSRYQDQNGMWRERVFDNRYIFSLEGGYKPNSQWEFSARWIFAGGPPYTPVDEAASRQVRRSVLDEDKINQARYPDYHSLNVRFDRRFHFSNSNLVFYFSVWNAYNRKNVATYFWNEAKNQVDVIYQWTLLPIFGFEYEF